jgi:hypothetical protein
MRLITLIVGHHLIALETGDVNILSCAPNNTFIFSAAAAQLALPILWNTHEKTPKEHILEISQEKYVIRKPMPRFWTTVSTQRPPYSKLKFYRNVLKAEV